MKTKRKKTRASNGEGSLYYSNKLKKWVFVFTERNGKRRTVKQKKGETATAFKKKITKLKASIDNGTYCEKNNLTIYEYAKEIVENELKRNKIGTSTYFRKLNTLKVLEESKIASLPIQKTTYRDLQDFIDSLQDYSNSYIQKVFNLIGKVFKEAVKFEIISKNPVIHVEKPTSKKENKKVEAFSIEEQKAFVEALQKEDDKIKNIFSISLFTGMRIGEVLALSLDDINFKENTITVNRSLSKDEKGNTILGNSTKTINSVRVIPITDLFKTNLVNAIHNMIPNTRKLLFLNSEGNLMYPNSTNAIFKKICKNANIGCKTYTVTRNDRKNERIVNISSSSYHQHMLRHTYATRCIEAGIPAEVLQKLLGHKNIETTINTYTTIFDKFKQKQVDKYVSYIENLA